MNRIRTVAVIAVATLGLGGCFTSNPNQGAGTIFGAATGAVVGGAASGSTGGALVGALAGGMIGNIVGANMDAANRKAAADAEYRALEYGRTGVPIDWRGKDGYSGNVVAGAPYRVNDVTCRDYTQTIIYNGQPQTARGTACKQADGNWRTVG